MSNAVEIAFLEVGHGDSIVIIYPDQTTAMVIDTPDARITYDYLVSKGIKTVDWMIISHGDKDHYGGILQLINNLADVGISTLKLGYIRGDKRISSEASYKRLRKQLVEVEDRLGIDTPPPCANVIPKLSHQNGMEIRCLYPQTQADIESAGDESNDWSIVVMMEYDGKRALLSADLEGHGWFRLNKKMGKNKNLLKAEVFKIPHHGRWFDGGNQKLSSEDVLCLVNPEIVIISEGFCLKDSRKKVINSLRELNPSIRLLCTGRSRDCDDLNNISNNEKTVNGRNALTCAGTISITFGNGKIGVTPSIIDHANIKSNLAHPLCS
jgi:competence protein ComEC